MNGRCSSLSSGSWPTCNRRWGCSQGCSCGCTGDGTPACNACAQWGQAPANTPCQCGRCGGNPSCGCCNCDTVCNACGNDPCTCGLAGSGGCLVPRIISTGRTFQRRMTQTLCVTDLPEYAEQPLTLMGVTVCGQSTWEQINECRQSLLRVTVPVAVQVRDCAGRCLTGHSTVTLTIPLCLNCPAQDFWRGQLFVAPCVRLASHATQDEDGCFDAPLEVQAEVYLVRMQVINC